MSRDLSGVLRLLAVAIESRGDTTTADDVRAVLHLLTQTEETDDDAPV